MRTWLDGRQTLALLDMLPCIICQTMTDVDAGGELLSAQKNFLDQKLISVKKILTIHCSEIVAQGVHRIFC